MMHVVALAGGVGGAKLADGLAQALAPENLTVIVNTGDDFEHMGLTICPDLDTVCYTLAGIANPQTGWGRAEESWLMMAELERLGGPTWFQLGDRDLGTNLERSRRLDAGEALSAIVADFCAAWGIRVRVLPMSDDPVRTIVETQDGELAFQDYFVARRCEPAVKGFRFEGIDHAKPAPGLLEALDAADLVVICPSNPWVSIDPILAVPGVRAGLEGQTVLAVSPIIGGEAVKGPAAKMYRELGIEPSALAVAKHYAGLLAGFVFDRADVAQEAAIADLGLTPFITDSLMKTSEDRRRLAQEVLAFAESLAAVST